MRKDYGKVTSFRMDKDATKLLDECFDMLNIYGTSMNAKMDNFIHRTHGSLTELKDIRKKLEERDKEIKELKKSVPSILEQKQSDKVETKIPSIPIQKVEAPTSPPERVVYDPKEHALQEKIEQPKPGECLRGIRTAQWNIACDSCRTLHRQDYLKCEAPQKPKGTIPLKQW
jgi:hypothetical protein